MNCIMGLIDGNLEHSPRESLRWCFCVFEGMGRALQRVFKEHGGFFLYTSLSAVPLRLWPLAITLASHVSQEKKKNAHCWEASLNLAGDQLLDLQTGNAAQNSTN